METGAPAFAAARFQRADLRWASQPRAVRAALAWPWADLPCTFGAQFGEAGETNDEMDVLGTESRNLLGPAARPVVGGAKAGERMVTGDCYLRAHVSLRNSGRTATPRNQEPFLFSRYLRPWHSSTSRKVN